MCLFPKKITDYNSSAYRHGMREFDCGSCPECLAKRARFWALRAVMEAKNAPSMMITLTYDQEIRDRSGNVIGERLPDLLKVDKRDAQLFIKRLRKHFGDRKIKYILTAEYGKSTHRPHYHALIFGAVFHDLVYRKRSKRGNIIYSSPSLSKIWRNGICSVDNVNATAATARYCTKYTAKDGRSADTFMLFSRGVGDAELLRRFNGKSYIVDGQEYPIPRQIWSKVLCNRYGLVNKYFAPPSNGDFDSRDGQKYIFYARRRQEYQAKRDADLQYQAYIAYWKNKVEKSYQKDAITRILELDSSKYGVYKSKALTAYGVHHNGFPLLPPRSERYAKVRFELVERIRRGRQPMNEARWKVYNELLEGGHLPVLPCHITANDTNNVTDYDILRISADKNGVLYDDFVLNLFKLPIKMLDNFF